MQTIHRTWLTGAFRAFGLVALGATGCGGSPTATPDAGASPALGGSQPAQEGGSPSSVSTGDDAGAASSGLDATTPSGSEAGAPEAGAVEASAGTGPVTCLASTPPAAGDTTATIESGGVARSYILHIPPGYAGSKAVPLVLDFHYILGTAQGEESVSGYSTLADQEGFVVAFPNGIDNAWNIGPCCTTSRTVDDVGFARDLVKKLEGTVCVDPKRVYAVGFSMGGGMSHYLACNAADVFAAVAPSAFDLLTPDEEPCTPSRPITEISFRGTADPIVPYAGGLSMPPNGLNVTIDFMGAVDTFQRWSQIDQCTGSPSAADANGCQTYSSCAQGTEVTLCTAQGGGHSPGSATVGWAMLSAHPMP